MTFADPPRSPLRRAVYRAPVWIYRLGLGGVLGSRFVLLTHRGRATGQVRQVVLEVVGREDASGGYLVASGYGARSQWFQNIRAEPRVLFQVGWRRYRGSVHLLPPAESGAVLAAYARRHPAAADELMRALGHDCGSGAQDRDAAYRRIGADAERGVPVLALRPAQPVD
ncbi:nitroreductase family deazaflavin-dependent oxidoreductase [Lipingzhangella sp. LS1_29]|uniref:Nitroreductase family deazaflavin-dependent oxidoreductase n=1 Tax=Lipingzhangella rawalii TaxID=2055835 RepID=A0ABU2H6U6_9ACTN|nr:nitroreductase family deazaflavin-dependent oxidoreductase [Lipingzhangella rawalii]MDS1271032.1 nitroreductase family deazaflavin-dependent oxidoreductase [Lipingzhangella rawalii]